MNLKEIVNKSGYFSYLNKEKEEFKKINKLYSISIGLGLLGLISSFFWIILGLLFIILGIWVSIKAYKLKKQLEPMKYQIINYFNNEKVLNELFLAIPSLPEHDKKRLISSIGNYDFAEKIFEFLSNYKNEINSSAYQEYQNKYEDTSEAVFVEETQVMDENKRQEKAVVILEKDGQRQLDKYL